MCRSEIEELTEKLTPEVAAMVCEVLIRSVVAELSCKVCGWITYIYEDEDLGKRPAEWLRLHRKQCHKGE